MSLTYKQAKVILLTIKFLSLLMRILASTLTCSSLEVKTQSHQPLLSAIKHLSNNCVGVLLTLKNILLATTIIPIISNRTVFNSTLQHFSQWIQLFLDMKLPKFFQTATLNQIHVTNMSKLNKTNTYETSKKLTPLNLQLTLNTHI